MRVKSMIASFGLLGLVTLRQAFVRRWQ